MLLVSYDSDEPLCFEIFEALIKNADRDYFSYAYSTKGDFQIKLSGT